MAIRYATATLAGAPLALLFLIIASSSFAAGTLTCIPSQKFLCSTDGCKAVPAKVHVVIDTDKQTYSRCDKKGCDKYDATMSEGGIYLNVTVATKSVVTKVEIPSLRYFETLSLGLTVLTSFGKCSSQ